MQLFDGLLRFNNNLDITPALAHDWKVSADGRTYTFNLRTGVRFHNGREITADDFVYSLTRLLDPRQESEDAQLYSLIEGTRDYQSGKSLGVSGLKALSPSTLQITLERTYAPFLRVLALQPASVVPREEIEKMGSSFGQAPVGSGAFRFHQWDPEKEIVLAANSDYFEGKPYLNEIRFSTMPALNSLESFKSFREGRIDLSFVPLDQTTIAQSTEGWTFISRPVLRLLYLGINVRDPLMRNPFVRNAVSCSINKSAIMGQEIDYSITHGLIPVSLLGSDPFTYPDPYDAASAKDFLSRSHVSKSHRVRIKLWHVRASASRNQLLARIVENLESIGFAVQLKLLPSMGQLLEKIYEHKTQLFLLGEQMDFPDPDALLTRLFNSKSKGNPFGYNNPKVDQMLDDAQSTLDESRRAQIYRQIEKTILDDHIIVPLSLVKYSFVHHKRLQGLEINPLGFQYLPFRKVWMQEQVLTEPLPTR